MVKSSAGAVGFGLLPLGDSPELAEQTLEIAVEAGEREPGIEDFVAADRGPQRGDRLVANWHGGRLLGLRRHRDRDQPGVLAMRTGHLDQRLLIVLAEHFQLAISQTLAALRALEAAGLPAQNVQNVHDPFLPQIAGAQSSEAYSRNVR